MSARGVVENKKRAIPKKDRANKSSEWSATKGGRDLQLGGGGRGGSWGHEGNCKGGGKVRKGWTRGVNE